jgi:hypothetical protein
MNYIETTEQRKAAAKLKFSPKLMPESMLYEVLHVYINAEVTEAVPSHIERTAIKKEQRIFTSLKMCQRYCDWVNMMRRDFIVQK